MSALERSAIEKNGSLEILKTGCYREVAAVESWPFVAVPLYGIKKYLALNYNIVLKMSQFVFTKP